MKLVIGTNIYKRILSGPVDIWAIVEVREVDLEHFSKRPEDFKHIPLDLTILRFMFSVSFSSKKEEFYAGGFKFVFDSTINQNQLMVFRGYRQLPNVKSLDELQALLRGEGVVLPRIQKAQWVSFGYKAIIEDEYI